MSALSTQTGYTGKIAGVFWTQGESDAIDGEPYCDEYGSNLFNFVTALRQVFDSPRLPFVYGRITCPWINSESVRAGQEALTNLLSDVYMVDADDLVTPTLHYDNEGTMTLGNRYAAGFESIMNSRNTISLTYQSQPTLTITGAPNTEYVLQYSEDLKTWNTPLTLKTDVLGYTSFTDEHSPRSKLKFYRLSQVALPEMP